MQLDVTNLGETLAAPRTFSDMLYILNWYACHWELLGTYFTLPGVEEYEIPFFLATPRTSALASTDVLFRYRDPSTYSKTCFGMTLRCKRPRLNKDMPKTRNC